jgi:quinolinate synthase
VKDHTATQFVILSEQGLVARMQADIPEKEITTVFPLPLCPNMKYHSLENLYLGIKEEFTEIKIPDEIIEPARLTIERMLEISNRRKTWSGPVNQG